MCAPSPATLVLAAPAAAAAAAALARAVSTESAVAALIETAEATLARAHSAVTVDARRCSGSGTLAPGARRPPNGLTVRLNRSSVTQVADKPTKQGRVELICPPLFGSACFRGRGTGRVTAAAGRPG